MKLSDPPLGFYRDEVEVHASDVTPVQVKVVTQQRYSLLDLTQEQFDVIVGCLHTGECGGTDKGDGVPYYKNGEIYNGVKGGGALVLEAIPGELLAASLRRLGCIS